MALFQQPSRPQGLVHVEFKAGRCEYDGRMITPDKRKGKVVLFTSEEEQLMHLQWHDREKSECVNDLIVINDAYFQKIEKCKDGRVYILRFTSSDKKMFFWMQEPDADGDAALISKFNEAVGATIPAKSNSIGTGGSGSAAIAAVRGAAAGDIDPALQNALQQFLQGQGAGAGLPGAAQGQGAAQASISDVLTPELLASLAEDETASAELMQHLPESHRTREGLRGALGSPQLQQSLRGVAQAVHSDQLPVICSSLNLDPGALASAAVPGTDPLEALCRAMERSLNPGAPGDAGSS